MTTADPVSGAPRDCRPYLERVLRADLLAGSAYHVPPAAGLVKLDAMENPYGWPEALSGVLRERLAAVSLNRYPDPQAGELKTLLADFLALPAGAGLLLGNGSDELIQLLALAVHANGGGVLAPEPSFSMYRIIADSLGMPYTGVPLAAGDFSLQREAMLAAIAGHAPALVFLASPNNPTGNRFAEADVLAVVDAAPGLVLVDEAYAPFADGDLMRLVSERPNVLVLRTLSKMGLAGLRLGALAGPAAWIEQLEKLRLPYNINSLTQAAAAAALSDPAPWLEQVALITAERARLLERLREHAGLRAWPSETNFLLVAVPGAGAATAAHLLAGGVLVKNLHGSHPLLADCVRVTVGRPAENDRLLEVLSTLPVPPVPAAPGR